MKPTIVLVHGTLASTLRRVQRADGTTDLSVVPEGGSHAAVVWHPEETATRILEAAAESRELP